MPHILIEAAISGLHDALAAEAAGADRLELSIGLEVGGLTPSTALVERVVGAASVPVIALVRPRVGGFAYEDAEVNGCAAEIERLIGQGVTGVAMGVLDGNGRVDIECNRRLMDVARSASLPIDCVFHRAIDVTRDALRSLDALIELGFDRVLTSGQSRDAATGADVIRSMQEHAAGRIEICPGGGVRANNVLSIIAKTGCSQIHGTFSTLSNDDAGPVGDSQFSVFDPNALQKVRAALDS